MAEIKLRQLREQLREMSDEDLYREIAVQRAALFEMRRVHSMKQLTSTVTIRNSRRQIARALTILREREIARQREAKQ